MLVYWLLFSLAALAVLLERQVPIKHAGLLTGLVWVLLSAAIGFRYEVGGDWLNYGGNLYALIGLPLSAALLLGDPGYQFLSWASLSLGWDIYGVNAACGMIFSLGLVAFCRAQPRFWLALTISIPYLVIVVAMGYTRQGVAIGLSMLAFNCVARGQIYRALLWVAAAALFHKTAIILLPLVFVAGSKHGLIAVVLSVGLFACLYVFLLRDSTDDLYRGYIEASYQSDGALIRVVMNGIPAAIFVLMRRRFRLSDAEDKLWGLLAWTSLATLFILPVSPSSTAIDRIALYEIPLQLFIFCRIPSLASRKELNLPISLGVVLYYAAVEFAWLNYATNASSWLPYQSILL